MVHPSVPDGVFVALKIMYNMGLSSSGSIQKLYSVDFAVLQKLPRHRNINRYSVCCVTFLLCMCVSS